MNHAQGFGVQAWIDGGTNAREGYKVEETLSLFTRAFYSQITVGYLDLPYPTLNLLEFKSMCRQPLPCEHLP